MHRRLLIALLLVSFAAPLSALAPSSPSIVAEQITAESIVIEMNRHRAAEGLDPLVVEPRVTMAAEDRMRDMEELSYWSHRSPEGMSPFTWLTSRGYRFRFAGENLAAGFDTTRVLVDSWMESRGHRANILSANFRDCGIAIIDGRTTGRASGKSIVVLFATERLALIR